MQLPTKRYIKIRNSIFHVHFIVYTDALMHCFKKIVKYLWMQFPTLGHKIVNELLWKIVLGFGRKNLGYFVDRFLIILIKFSIIFQPNRIRSFLINGL
jgi:hypothetical protein